MGDAERVQYEQLLQDLGVVPPPPTYAPLPISPADAPVLGSSQLTLAEHIAGLNDFLRWPWTPDDERAYTVDPSNAATLLLMYEGAGWIVDRAPHEDGSGNVVLTFEHPAQQ